MTGSNSVCAYRCIWVCNCRHRSSCEFTRLVEKPIKCLADGGELRVLICILHLRLYSMYTACSFCLVCNVASTCDNVALDTRTGVLRCPGPPLWPGCAVPSACTGGGGNVLGRPRSLPKGHTYLCSGQGCRMLCAFDSSAIVRNSCGHIQGSFV